LVLLVLLHLPLICALPPPPLLLLVLLLPAPPPLLLLPPLLARVGPLELRPLYLQGNHRLPAQEGFATRDEVREGSGEQCEWVGEVRVRCRYASAPSLPSYATSAVDDDMWLVACTRNRREHR
jgi:hypothetical protein